MREPAWRTRPIPGAFRSPWRKYRTPDCIAISRLAPPHARPWAEVAGLRQILSVSASLDVTPESGGRVHVEGRVRARVGQTCVVTLDPIENDIDEPIDLIFAPPEQIPQLADLVDEAAESDAEIPDPPEPDRKRRHRSWRLATDALFLGIDPYPRGPDAVSSRRLWLQIPRITRLPHSRRCGSMQPPADAKKPRNR